ncbi:hypothetical protein N7448_003879 [Penicillium atrosanguineum]|nr:hypothetical protein N7448_003879 [Penicillium atrosanguineum]
MTEMAKADVAHLEWEEPAFLQLDKELSLFETIKVHRRALLLCGISFTAATIFGYDTIVNGAGISMPAFILYFGEKDASGPWSGCFAGVITLVGATVQFTAVTRSSLLGGKIVSGLGIGMAMSIGTTYASEVVPARLVPPVQQALVIFILIMQALAMGVIRIFVPNVAPHAFRTVFAIQWGVYNILNNRGDKAKKLFRWMYGDNAEADERYNYLVQIIEEENSQRSANKASFIECFQGINLKRTFSIMFLFAIVNLAGAPFLSQSIYFLISVGLPAIHVFDISVGGFGLAIIIIIVSGISLKNVARRTVLFWGTMVNFLFMVVIGGLYYAPGDGPKWAIAILMNLLISLQAAFMQATGWSIGAEISSYRLRAKSMSLGIMAQTLSTWLITFVVPYMYNVDSGNLGAKTGFVFAGMTVPLLIGVFYLTPETTGLTTEDIDKFYEAKVPPHRFAKHKAEIQAE